MPIAPRLPRAVTAASSLGTMRARIVELQRIVADPERRYPALSPDMLRDRIANHQAEILRITEMERAKSGSRSIFIGNNIAAGMSTNVMRTALRAPRATIHTLRSQINVALDGLGLSMRTDVLNGRLLEDSKQTDESFAIIRARLDDAQAAIHRQIESNLLALYGDASDYEQEGPKADAEVDGEKATGDALGTGETTDM